MGELLIGPTKYFVFYNDERMHQSLQNKTPNEVYISASGGGALILDKYPRAQEGLPIALRSNGTLPAQIDDQKKQSQNRGSAVQLRVKSRAA